MNKRYLILLIFLGILILGGGYWFMVKNNITSDKINQARTNQSPNTVLMVNYEENKIEEKPFSGENERYYYFKGGVESTVNDYDEKVPVVEVDLLKKGDQVEIIEYGPNQRFLKSTLGNE